MDLPLGPNHYGLLQESEVEFSRQENAPNNTIYISNLNEKVPIDELKDALFNGFEEYG
jgi:hypothetical protein